MLTAIRLRDFKNHIDTEIRLGRLTCLVGPNGCGKTSVLEGIQFACTALARGAMGFFQGPFRHEDFTRKGAEALKVRLETADGESRTITLAVELELKQGAAQRINWAGEDELGYRVSSQWETNWVSDTKLVPWGKQPSGGGEDITSYRWNSDHIPVGFRNLAPTGFLFAPSIPHLRSPSYSQEEVPAMSPDGATLASVVAYLITTEPERFAELSARIREVVPAVERLRVRPAKVELTEPTTISVNRKEIPYWETREVIGHELLFDLKDAPGVPARAVSEGTLLVTALLTATVWNQGADVLMIDDLEKGLHPKAQRELVTALKALLAVDPRLQIAFSTHSPYVVDELDADQVWVLVPEERRGVVARRLSEHPRAADALQVLTTGEFLSAEGEDWVRETPETAEAA